MAGSAAVRSSCVGAAGATRARSIVFAVASLVAAAGASGAPPRPEPPTEWLRARPELAVTAIVPRAEVERRIGEEPLGGGDGVYRFGVEVPVGLATWDSGDWAQLGPESAWRLRVASPGAYSLNLMFDAFRLEPGARLYVVSESAGRVLGPYTSRDNRDDGLFATPPLPGDSALLVYLAPRRIASGFVLRNVVHGYRDLFGAIETGGPGGNSSACNIDINCPIASNHQDVKRAVALIVLGGGACSGSLVDNAVQDGTQLFLTARHCWANSGVNPGAWSFVFNFERPNCGSGTTSMADAVSGATSLAQSAGSDFMLVRIDAPIPPWFDVYFLGFDATGAVPPNVNSIHHPCGDPKKFNADEHAPTKSVFQGSQMWSIAKWEAGVNEPGSSGSPLLDPTRRVIGQLWGGAAVCGNSVNDFYGRLEISWNLGGAAALDPSGAGLQTSPGANGSNYLSVDIEAGAPVLPAAAEVGETIDVAFAIDSTGSYPPSTVDWTLWLSTDQTADPGDVPVASGTTASLGAQLESFALSFDLPVGVYYPILELTSQPWESDLLDNSAIGAAITVSASTKPNLTATAVSMAKVVEKGASLVADCEVAGNQFAPGSYSVEVRLSLDENVTTSDPLLGKATLSAYGPATVPITIPLSMTTGTYRVGLIVTPADLEIYLVDNSFLGEEVVVVPPPPPPPDVAVTNLKSPAKGKVGKKAKFEITLATSAFTGEFTYQVRLSPDPVITVDDVLVKSLKAKKGGTAKKELKIPPVEPGAWYVGVTVDPVAGELDFADNAIEGKPIQIKPGN